MRPHRHAEKAEMALAEAGRPDMCVLPYPLDNGGYSLMVAIWTEDGGLREPTDEECDVAVKACEVAAASEGLVGERYEGYPAQSLVVWGPS